MSELTEEQLRHAAKLLNTLATARTLPVPCGWTQVTDTAVEASHRALTILMAHMALPDRAMSTADGGIVLYFDRRDGAYGMFEIYDDGAVVAGYSDRVSPPQAWDLGFKPSRHSFLVALQSITKFLNEE